MPYITAADVRYRYFESSSAVVLHPPFLDGSENRYAKNSETSANVGQ